MRLQFLIALAGVLALGSIFEATLAPVESARAQLAQATSPTFELPSDFPTEGPLRLEGSPTMAVINRALADRIEADYRGAAVQLELTSSDQAIADLLAGDIDIAAVGRPLSAAELAQGLKEVPISREKIAVIVGPANPFSGNLTFDQFARMFRGEITDWAEVGGTPGPIRFVDRPDNSDTRLALSKYSVFTGAPFATGSNATQVPEDDTAAVIRELGSDGISYGIASQVLGQDTVKIVSMHQTLPDDPRYPYSQPRAYVYKEDASPAVAAFLGFATAAEGQAVIQAARLQEAAGVTAAVAGAADTPSTEAEATGGPTADAAASNAAAGEGQADSGAAGEVAQGNAAAETGAGAAASAAGDGRGLPAWLWWLLPVAGLGALAWGLSRRGGSSGTGGEAVAGVAGATTAAGSMEPLAASAPAAGAAAEPVPPVGLMAVAEGATASASTPTAAPPSPTAPPTVSPAAAEPLPHPPPTWPAESPPASANHPPLGPAVAGAAGLVAGAAAIVSNTKEQSDIEATKFDVVGRPSYNPGLADVDAELAELPDGYGESRIVLMPRDPRWAYAYWDTPGSHKEELRRQGGQDLALRLYDVTDTDLQHQNPHSMQQYACEEMARDWYLPIPVSDRDYLCEIGYLTPDGRWLLLARSNLIRVPPVFPSDWLEDHFMTVGWDEDLRCKTLMALSPPSQRTGGPYPVHQGIFDLAQSAEAQRVAGSLFGSMQHVPGSLLPQQGISSYIFPSGLGMGALPTPSGMVPNVSGLTESGIGLAASMPPVRPRQFWLVADAELIVYGATEPDATVTIGGQPIQLNEDGTFRFQMSFQDGEIDYPIMAVAADGEQARSIHLNFERETPERHTNAKEDAQDEWLS